MRRPPTFRHLWEIAAAILTVLGDDAYQRKPALRGASILAIAGTHTAADRV
ncbi:MAG: hypothetical protein H7288_14075 [Kineosporiaceae bacterium]|nr:hypothetical protein [Aeromicrobium sp.]